jgi:hypothetical protein
MVPKLGTMSFGGIVFSRPPNACCARLSESLIWRFVRSSQAVGAQ